MSTLRKRSLITHQNALIWLLPLSIIGLGGFFLLKKRNRLIETDFDYIDNTEYSGLKNLIIAQSKVESAGYTSALFLRSNNAFGMKNANVRNQLGWLVVGDPYRHYESLSESIKDFVLWLRFVGFPSSRQSVEQYAGNLKRLGYYEASQIDYVKALKSWL